MALTVITNPGAQLISRLDAMQKDRPVTRLVLALVPLALSIVVISLVSFLQVRGAMVLVVGSVAFAALVGGWRAGLLATLVGAPYVAWLLPPLGSFNIDTAADWARLGVFLGVAAMITWLTAERDAAYARERISAERLTEALVAARMGAWDMDLHDHTLWWSPGLIEIFGRRPATFSPTYDDFLTYAHPDDRGFLENAFTRSVEGGSEFEIEHRIIRPDHGVRFVITRGRVRYGPDGRPRRIIGVVADITERKHAELIPESSSPVVALRGRL